MKKEESNIPKVQKTPTKQDDDFFGNSSKEIVKRDNSDTLKNTPDNNSEKEDWVERKMKWDYKYGTAVDLIILIMAVLLFGFGLFYLYFAPPVGALMLGTCVALLRIVVRLKTMK